MKYTNLNLDNKKILITGGAGFIGSNLALHLQKYYPKSEIIVFDKFRSEETFSNGNLKSFGHFKNILDFKGEVISGDINSKDDLEKLSEYGFNYIFHQGAISDTTVQDQKIMVETNVNSFKNLLDIAVSNNATMIYASSAATYGNAESPQKIGDESPQNIYGFSKLMMDNIAYKYMEKYPNLKIIGLRYFNVYGKNEFFKGSTSSMILQFGLQILQGKNPKLFENSDKIFRDFIYIEDIIQANMKAMSGKSGVYNIGTGKARSFQDIVDILQKELKTDFQSIYIPNPYKSQYQFYTEADISKTIEKLGYSPNFTLENGIKSYLDEIIKIGENIN